MTGIFLSYASVDLKRARKLAKALEARGWSVWWDRKLPPGMNFSREILKQRSAARCVVVLWTKNSIESEWVEEEAHRAKKRECLVPVLLDDVEIPFGFGTRQAAGLIDWEGQQQHEGFEALVGAVTRHLGGARTDLTNPEPETEVSPDLSDSAQAPKPPPAVATVQLSPDARELTELQAIEMVAAQPQPRPKPEHQRSAPPQRASPVWTRLKATLPTTWSTTVMAR